VALSALRRPPSAVIRNGSPTNTTCLMVRVRPCCRGPCSVDQLLRVHFTAVLRLQLCTTEPRSNSLGSRSPSRGPTAPPPVCARSARPGNALRVAVASFEPYKPTPQAGQTVRDSRPRLDRLIWKRSAGPLAAPLGNCCRYNRKAQPYRRPQSWACAVSTEVTDQRSRRPLLGRPAG